MSDADRALAAASVLLTLVALLYSLWYGALSDAGTTAAAPDPKARQDQARRVRVVLRTKAVPLIIAAGLPVAVFLPVAAGAIVNAIRVVGSQGLDAYRAYDVVQAAFVAVYLLSGMLFGISLDVALDVVKRARLLGGSPDHLWRNASRS